jgi:hypothetical protein
MSPSPPPSPMSISSLIDDDDEDHRGGAADDDVVVHILKINVLYNKKHAAFPTRGRLKLSKQNLVFRTSSNGSTVSPGGGGSTTSSSSSGRFTITWELDSINIEKYRGKISGGIKIIPIVRPDMMMEGEVVVEGGSREEFIFTMVNDRSYRIIHEAVIEAKVNGAMKKVRRETLEIMENSSVGLRESLYVAGDEYGDLVGTQRLPLFVRPLQFICLLIIRLISYLFRKCTGRRISGPRDTHDALHGILTCTHQISYAASKLSLSEGRMRSIQKDIDSIRESITKIKQIHMRCQSTYMACGSVADASTPSRAFLETTGVSIAKIISIVALVWYAIRRVVNIPLFRFDQMKLVRHPPTVIRAVRDANDMVDAVIEFTWKDARDSVMSSKIDEEAERIRILLFNIKLCSAAGE